MQAAVLHRYNSPLEIVERPDLKPPPGWILVDVRGCGVCGSDVFLRKGGTEVAVNSGAVRYRDVQIELLDS